MSGHGHVTPNPDGTKARCGGPGFCPECSREASVAYQLSPATALVAAADWRIAAGIPRRACLDKNTPEELSIRTAIDAVERVGAHPSLTEAVVLLGQALNKLADYVDLHPPRDRYERPAPTAMPGPPERRG